MNIKFATDTVSDSEYHRYMKWYAEQHKCCPECGAQLHLTTLMGFLYRADKPWGERFIDMNTCTCVVCGFKHSRHSRVAEGFVSENKNLVFKAKSYALTCHQGHTYDGHPYERHLQGVVSLAHIYMDKEPMKSNLHPKERAFIEAACWLHDVIEDRGVTFSDLKEMFGIRVASIVYAVTNEKGRNRAERQNDKFYDELSTIPYASFVKACDRLANYNYSVSESSNVGKRQMYEKEMGNFVDKIKIKLGQESPSLLVDLVRVTPV